MNLGPSTWTAQRGSQAERRAERYLIRQGLKLIMRNWRCPLGELDLLMQDAEGLVVVEVRARQHSSHGGALESVGISKQRKIARTAQRFLQDHPQWQDQPIRFDVVCFEGDETLLWVRNAFDMDDL